MKRRIVSISLIIMLLLGFVSLEAICLRIDVTGVNLLMCHIDTQNADYYGDFSAIQEVRNSLYNSDNLIVRTYSNLTFVPKLVVLIISFGISLLFPYSLIFSIVYSKKKEKERRKRRKRRERKIKAEEWEKELLQNEKIVYDYICNCQPTTTTS